DSSEAYHLHWERHSRKLIEICLGLNQEAEITVVKLATKYGVSLENKVLAIKRERLSDDVTNLITEFYVNDEISVLPGFGASIKDFIQIPVCDHQKKNEAMKNVNIFSDGLLDNSSANITFQTLLFPKNSSICPI
ncbi:hypothetical protein ANN_15342, partial [Periplaneta americana]